MMATSSNSSQLSENLWLRLEVGRQFEGDLQQLESRNKKDLKTNMIVVLKVGGSAKIVDSNDD